MFSLGGEAAFPPGSSVQFNTCLGSTVQGEVVCFDPTLKVLAIKDSSNTEGKPILRIFNMSSIGETQVINSSGNGELVENFISNCTISSQQAQDRCNNAQSRRSVELMHEDVSLEGQKAFVQLRRILDEVCWMGRDIVVLNKVVVEPPYEANNVRVKESGDQAEAALKQVRKILSKPFVYENKLTPCHKA